MTGVQTDEEECFLLLGVIHDGGGVPKDRRFTVEATADTLSNALTLKRQRRKNRYF